MWEDHAVFRLENRGIRSSDVSVFCQGLFERHLKYSQTPIDACEAQRLATAIENRSISHTDADKTHKPTWCNHLVSSFLHLELSLVWFNHNFSVVSCVSECNFLKRSTFSIVCGMTDSIRVTLCGYGLMVGASCGTVAPAESPAEADSIIMFCFPVVLTVALPS